MENSALESGIMTRQRHRQTLANKWEESEPHWDAPAHPERSPPTGSNFSAKDFCRVSNLSNVVVMKRPLTPPKVGARQGESKGEAPAWSH